MKIIVAAKIFSIFIFFSVCLNVASASENQRKCHGNIETYERHIIKAGVTYMLSYSIKGKNAKVQFAGREFDAIAEKGNTYKGLWIQKLDDGIYFSFLPDEGGTIKFEFEKNVWFSGNC